MNQISTPEGRPSDNPVNDCNSADDNCSADNCNSADNNYSVNNSNPADDHYPVNGCSSADDCCAVLLRGGKSRRMGRDKALLPWKESTFLETVASQLEFLDEKYLSVAAMARDSDQDSRSASEKDTKGNRRENDSDQGSRSASEKGTKASRGENDSDQDRLSDDWIRLPDLIPDCGPLGGIYTALHTCEAEWALVVSCDIPAVEQPLLKMLLEERGNDVDIIYPLTPDGRMHLTCAVYRKAIAPILRQQIEKGDNRLRVLLDLCRAKAIRLEQPDLIRMVSNINTGEDFARILKE